jgi:hypothetical protein
MTSCHGFMASSNAVSLNDEGAKDLADTWDLPGSVCINKGAQSRKS